MKKLFIDIASYAEGIQKGRANSRRNLYKTTLEEQFEALTVGLPEEYCKFEDYKDMITQIFKVGMSNTFKISLPNFERELNPNKEVNRLKNVVIKPIKSNINLLPNNQTLLLVGDVFIGNRIRFDLKGMQFINRDLEVESDLEITAIATLVDRASRYEERENVLTRDLINKLCTTSYTVDNVVEFNKFINKWYDYLNFRQEFLKHEESREYEFDELSLLPCYYVDTINKSNREDVKNLAADNEVNLGLKGYISTNDYNSEKTMLLKITRDFNLKQNFDNLDEIRKEIYSFTGRNLYIPKTTITQDTNNHKNKYCLGDKVLQTSCNVEPTTDHIISKYAKLITSENNRIDSKYDTIIKKELENMVEEYSTKLESDMIEEVNSTVFDVSKEVEDSYTKQVKSIKNDYKSKLKKAKSDKKEVVRLEDEINDKIDAVDKVQIENNLIKQQKDKLQTKLKTTNDNLVKNFTEESKNGLTIKFSNVIKKEKDDSKVKLNKEKELEVKKYIEDETVMRVTLYFVSDEESKVPSTKILKYNSIAEKAKLDRQQIALDCLYTGEVKNPYLTTYLFSPTYLKGVQTDIDVDFFFDRLNSKQREAVKKAMLSSGIFLIQGPPGTGKTEVIAEIVYQNALLGKKVIVSSETNKAIDNVFDRVPKIPSLRPIRLMANTKKDSDYAIDKLTDNLYKNIRYGMNKEIEKFTNHKEFLEKSSDKIKELENLYKIYEKNKSTYEESEMSLKKFELQLNKLIKENNEIVNNLRDINKNTKLLNGYISSVEKLRTITLDDNEYTTLCDNYNIQLNKIITKYAIKDLSMYIRYNSDSIIKEFNKLKSGNQSLVLKQKANDLRSELDSYRNDLGDFDAKFEKQYKSVQKELKTVLGLLKEAGSSDSFITEIFNHSILDKSNIDDVLNSVNSDISTLKTTFTKKLNVELENLSKAHDNIKKSELSNTNERSILDEKIQELNDNNTLNDIKETKRKITEGINNIKNLLNVVIKSTDEKEAIKELKDSLKVQKDNLLKEQTDRERKVPAYKNIVKYISDEDVVTNDRKKYTKSLFDQSNLFGLTCTSRDSFKEDTSDLLSEYGLGDIDIKSLDVDVVIIDEVSKSSFLELLIPILNGKSVILVGDHRQLPPMYEYSKLRKEEFEGLEDIVTYEENQEYTKMYQDCFFKILFEKVPANYKVMLEAQFRCHSAIMSTFNNFYDGRLKLGYTTQDSDKQHNLSIPGIKNKSINVIDPSKAVYFINSKEYENRVEGSTSISNENEALIVKTLIEKLNIACEESKTKLSTGVICTYGDQVKKIKQKVKPIKKNYLSTEEDKFVVNTVDDFQGDERDIIIVSMVRSPKNSKNTSDFIKQYQRINVAFSRARKLLIIVGNKDYLCSKGVIDLPDLDGDSLNDKKGFRVYEEIINSIEENGKVLEDYHIIRKEDADE